MVNKGKTRSKSLKAAMKTTIMSSFRFGSVLVATPPMAVGLLRDSVVIQEYSGFCESVWFRYMKKS